MSEGPFGRSQGRTKFAEPNNDRVMLVYPALEQQVTIHLLSLFSLFPQRHHIPLRIGEVRHKTPLANRVFGRDHLSSGFLDRRKRPVDVAGLDHELWLILLGFALVEPAVDASGLKRILVFVDGRGVGHRSVLAPQFHLPVEHLFIKVFGLLKIRGRDLKEYDLVFHGSSPFVSFVIVFSLAAVRSPPPWRIGLPSRESQKRLP